MTTYNHPFLASIFIYIKLRCSFHEHKVEIMSAHLLSLQNNRMQLQLANKQLLTVQSGA